MVVSHFHPDHVGGLGKVVERLRIGKLVDRGFPDYGAPAPPKGAVFDAYRKAAEEAGRKGTVRERARAGRADQIVPLRGGPVAGFEVRVVAANGEVWTGKGDAAAPAFPPLPGVPEPDRPQENPCSVALLVRYGGFSLYTGGDLYGMPEPGAPSWWDVETPIAKAIGKTDVLVVNHHGSIEPANPFFLATLAPRVVIVPAWSPTHPSPDVLKRLLSKRIWPGPRDVFVTRLRDATKATIGPRAERGGLGRRARRRARRARRGELSRIRPGRHERERRREVRARAVRVERAVAGCRHPRPRILRPVPASKRSISATSAWSGIVAPSSGGRPAPTRAATAAPGGVAHAPVDDDLVAERLDHRDADGEAARGRARAPRAGARAEGPRRRARRRAPRPRRREGGEREGRNRRPRATPRPAPRAPRGG